MSSLDILKILAIILTVIVFGLFLYYRSRENIDTISKLKTGFIGFISNFFDTFGIGSFATIVAMRRIFKIMPDDVRMIGSMNIHSMVTALLQSLIFLAQISLDSKTLFISVCMIALGGFLSGIIAVRVNKVRVHNIMLIAFILSGILILLVQLHILDMNGTATSITGIKLIVFAIFMLLAGALPAFGVGYYSLVQISIFMLGVNPIIAFPIMATASAFQMPLTAVPFILKQKFYYKSTIILAIAGAIGVLLAAPLISMINDYTLKWILLVIVVYNVITLSRTIKNNKTE